MRRTMQSAIIAYLAVLLFLPAWSASAQTAKIPVTYPGDTMEKTVRRDAWVQGARKEGKLIWWGTLSPAESQKLIAAFNKIYPFIEVEYWRGTGEELASKVEAQDSAGRFSVDVCLGSDPIRFITWRKMGLLQPFGDIIPGVGKMDKRMYSKYGDWFVVGNNAITPQYNTKLVPASEAPKSWEGLLDPKWKGQLGVSTNSMEHWANLALAEGGWGIEKTEDFLRKLKTQEVVWGRGYSATYALLVAGEFKVSAQGHIYNILQAQTKGSPPAEWGRVNPILITGPPITIQKNAKHSNAAKLFIEWLFSPQGLEVYEDATGRGAPFPGSGTRLSKVLEGHKLVYRTEETEQRMADLGLIDKFSKIMGMTQ